MTQLRPSPKASGCVFKACKTQAVTFRLLERDRLVTERGRSDVVGRLGANGTAGSVLTDY